MSRSVYTLLAAVIGCFLLTALVGCDTDLLNPVPGYYNGNGYEQLGKSPPLLGLKHRHGELGAEADPDDPPES